MAVQTGLERTLSQVASVLYNGRREAVRVTITGIAGEFDGVPMSVHTFGSLPFFPSKSPEFIDRREVKLAFFQNFRGSQIQAKAPEGVGQLDIVYDVRTGSDA